MPTTPSRAQTEVSRLNGAKSSGPASDAGKARSALNGIRQGLCGRTFFLLPDEDPADFREHEATWLAAWSPRDLHEHEAAAAAIRATWREIRADRLEAAVLSDLFAAGAIVDDAERQAAKVTGMKALGTLLRYRSRIEREHRQAMDALDALRQRRLSGPSPARRHEPEPLPAAPLADGPPAAATARRATSAGPSLVPATARAAVPPSEPERPLNRHQRRALAAMARHAA